MDSKHTPGPWKHWLDTNNNQFLIFQDLEGRGYGRMLAQVVGEKGKFEANAALIAAAPDLLDSLERFVHMAECNTIPGPNTIAQAKAHIAKARGTE